MSKELSDSDKFGLKMVAQSQQAVNSTVDANRLLVSFLFLSRRRSPSSPASSCRLSVCHVHPPLFVFRSGLCAIQNDNDRTRTPVPSGGRDRQGRRAGARGGGCTEGVRRCSGAGKSSSTGLTAVLLVAQAARQIDPAWLLWQLINMSSEELSD